MRTITIGVDLAKQVFSVCSVDLAGRVQERRDLRRDAFRQWLPSVLAGTIVAMEACSGAHHWGLRCLELGLQPRLIAAQFVTPFRKSRTMKNDRNDAEAIATAARQGNMRFVGVKNVEQQARLAWHRVREGYKTESLAVSNRLRGLLAELGLVIAQSDAALRLALSDLAKHQLPAMLIELLVEHTAHWQQLRERIATCDRRIEAHAKADERCVRKQSLALGQSRLTPTQHSSGGHDRLGNISCRGDSYLRTLLIQGARSSLQRAQAVTRERATPEQIWTKLLAARLPFGKVLVAIANKHARQLWVMLARGEAYDANAWIKHPMVQR